MRNATQDEQEAVLLRVCQDRPDWDPLHAARFCPFLTASEEWASDFRESESRVFSLAHLGHPG